MSSVLQSGFLNRIAGSSTGAASSRKCLTCSKVSAPENRCNSCEESFVCKSCVTANSGGQELRECETCQKYFCADCRHVCHDPDCQAVHCTECSSMAPCVSCGGMFCTEETNDEMECAARCNCNNMICDSCQSVCNLCDAALCDSCKQGCSKCFDEFCSDCKNFLVKCEFCDNEYCLICCAKKTTCVGCMKKPSRSRLVEATSQLKRVQKTMARGLESNAPATGAAGASPDAAAAGPSQEEIDAQVEAEAKSRAKKAAEEAAAEKKAAEKAADEERAAAAERERVAAAAAIAEAKARKEEVERAMASARASAEEMTAALAAVDNSGSSHGGAADNKQRGTNMMPKKTKKKKKKKKKGSSSTDTSAAGATVAPSYAAPPPAPAASVAAPQVVASDAQPVSLVETAFTDESMVYIAQYGVADDSMDHKVIKKWVLNVAAHKTNATASQIRRYFKGRVDPDVIDSYLEAFNNNCRDTVIQCAEFLNIFVPKEEPEKEVVAADPVEDVDDDLVGGAFAAKERSRIGDYDFAEHPLEKRANEAFQNDCKDLKLLQAILDEAKGQQGLAGTRKMVTKMVKRIKKAQEEEKKLHLDQKREDSKKEISQQLHPAYATSKPAFNSYQPPSIAADKQPDAMVDVPPNVVGWVIGKNGSRINDIQQRTNAAMWMDQNFPEGEMRKLHIHGNKAQVEAAIQEVEFLMNSAPVNNSRPGKGSEYQAVPPGHPDIAPPPPVKGHANRMIECPHALVGYLIGKKGAMIKRIKSHSNANVEVYQQFPDGVPRKVFISGTPEAVDLAVYMVEEVIASGKVADSPTLEASTTASSNASVDGGAGNGPVLGFGSGASQDSPSLSVETITHDFGDLGGLGNGAVGSYPSTMNGAATTSAQLHHHHHQQQQQQRQIVDTQSAIERLHQGLGSASPSGAVPGVSIGGGLGPGAPPGAPPGLAGNTSGAFVGGGGIHQEYLQQQEALRNKQKQQWQQQHQHQLWINQQLHLQQQQQQQHVQQLGATHAPALPTISANGSGGNTNTGHAKPMPPPGLPPARSIGAPVQPTPVGLGGVTKEMGDDGRAPNGKAAPAASPSPPAAFASVEDLLVSVGYLSLLPNFLEQEFDVGAIALMTDKDFEEISVPKGPQLKIQRACREAGLKSHEDTPAARPALAGSAAGSTSQATSSSEGGEDTKGAKTGLASTGTPAKEESSDCHICFERPIEVTFVTCGHQICCEKCGKEQEGRPCPICRKMIQSAVKFYK